MDFQSNNDNFIQNSNIDDDESKQSETSKETPTEKEESEKAIYPSNPTHFEHFDPNVFKSKQITSKRYFNVEEDYLIQTTYKEYKGQYTITQLCQELVDTLKNYGRSSESIRDRIKRYLSKISKVDEQKIIETRKTKPDWYIHWRQSKKHAQSKEIDVILELPNSKQLGSYVTSLKVKPEKRQANKKKSKKDELDLAWDKDVTPKIENKCVLEKREVSSIDKNLPEPSITRCPNSTDKKFKSEETLTNSGDKPNKNQNFGINDWVSMLGTTDSCPQKDLSNKVNVLLSMLDDNEELLNNADIVSQIVNLLANNFNVDIRDVIIKLVINSKVLE